MVGCWSPRSWRSSAAAAGWQLWNRYQYQQDAAAAARYVAVQDTTERPGGSQSAQPDSPALDQLAATAPEGYKTLARSARRRTEGRCG